MEVVDATRCGNMTSSSFVSHREQSLGTDHSTGFGDISDQHLATGR